MMLSPKNSALLILILVPFLTLIQWTTFVCKETSTSTVPLHQNDKNVNGDSYNTAKECPIVEDSVVIANRTVTYRFCKEKLQKPDQKVIIGVLSTGAKGFPQRQTIRNTWARHATNTYFLVAGVDEVNPELEDEMKKQHDIIWFNSPETYQNLVYKSMGFFAAVSHHGPNDYYFAYKTDDDVYIDMELLLAIANEDKDKDYVGYCHTTGKIHRDPEDRWYVSEESYPNATIYRPYADGGGYMLSRKLLSDYSSCLLQNMANNPFITMEDVALSEVARTCTGPDGRSKVSDADCTHRQHALIKFENVSQVKSYQNKNDTRVIALKELKSDWLIHMAHVQYCSHHRTNFACLDYNLSHDVVDSIMKNL